MSERWYCPNCGDYTEDREYRLKDDGFEDDPLCKHCGAECSDLVNDPRMGDLQNLVNELAETRLEYQTRISAVDTLADRIKKDWGVGEL